ncbi:MAG: protease self-immunity [Candidatus Paceibacter sp.]|jgi:membrane protease YdiL (CAAX protease family)|nr:protease self-immunity [Candidatus Paceibacter sp.]
MFKKSLKIYIFLVVLLAALNTLLVFLPMGSYVPAGVVLPPKVVQALVTIFVVLVVYGGLGFVGFVLARYLDIPNFLDERVSHKQRFVYPAIAGAIVGVALILGDFIFSKFNLIGSFIHPPFPTSIVASLSAGIGEEMIFRLFFITFWTWLLSSIIFRKKYLDTTYWIVATISALLFGLGHFPLLMALYGFPSIGTIPLILQIEVFLLNGIVGLVAAYYYKKTGFLGAVGVHFWTDIVWHVIFGLF